MQRSPRTFLSLLCFALVMALTPSSPSPAAAAQLGGQAPLDWPEEQRAFLQDGPGWLLSEAQVEVLLSAADPVARQALIDAFLDADPIPQTPENELREGIRRRLQFLRQVGLSSLDVRAQLVFLHGPPEYRKVIDCASAFRPIEIWAYDVRPELRVSDPTKTLTAPSAAVEGSQDKDDDDIDLKDAGRFLLVYQRTGGELFRLWLPLDSKRSLYTPELEYFLEQWEELRGRIRGRRFDYQICPQAELIDEITGIDGLFGFEEDRPSNQVFAQYLEPPSDLAAWARSASTGPDVEPPSELQVEELTIQYPERQGQRLLARFTWLLPESSNFEIATELEPPELDLTVSGVIEQDGAVFDTFRVRFNLEAPKDPAPLALVAERPLRPGRRYLARLMVRDEVGGAEKRYVRTIDVPDGPQKIEEPPLPEEAIVALGDKLARQRIAGHDSLVLVPPESDVILGLWRAEALVTGERIARVIFYVDGKRQLTRGRPPFTAEVRLSQFPTEQIVRAEGYDEAGELVASDEVILNQPRGSLRVRILEPKRGVSAGSTVQARAEVVVPEGRRVEKVEFFVNNELIRTLERPPWQAQVEVPQVVGNDLNYLTVVATLDDDARAEDVRFLTTPQYLEEVDVSLVELYTTVVDRNDRLAKGLTVDDFEVYEDGRRQKIAKFELVENLPLTIGIVIDTSGSMANSIIEAQQAATDFLANIVTRRDRCFAVGFSDRPVMLMPPTNDVDAVELSLQGLLAAGFTSLHDAIVTSLYYFRGVTGRRALVLLSDGDDTSSNLSFREALEYSRRTGVSVYTIGLDVGTLDLGIRDKLKDLSRETGGRSFFISDADELFSVYKEIEEELRSQYLIAYAPDTVSRDGAYREVEVKVTKRGLKARTARGYYN